MGLGANVPGNNPPRRPQAIVPGNNPPRRPQAIVPATTSPGAPRPLLHQCITAPSHFRSARGAGRTLFTNASSTAAASRAGGASAWPAPAPPRTSTRACPQRRRLPGPSLCMSHPPPLRPSTSGGGARGGPAASPVSRAVVAASPRPLAESSKFPRRRFPPSAPL